MTRRSKTVTWAKPDPTRLPDWTAEAVVLIADLERRGKLEELASKLRIRREGGYVGLDVMLLLLVLFSSRRRQGIKTFCRQLRPYQKQLAALAGRTSLPSQSSMSRALDAVSEAVLRPLYPWLLVEVAGAEEVLRHPSVVTRDATGAPWHVFDYDGSVHVLRHRALPAGEDLPDGTRRSGPIAAPGYAGRKRGDVQLHRSVLQHSGSGLWLFGALAPANGEHRRELDGALGTVVRTCEMLAHPLERALLRMDGEFGHVPDFTVCRAHQVPFVTRLNRPGLLDQPDVRQRLLEATWVTVPDSGGGPRRSAIELGQVTVYPGDDTLRDDGTPYDPIVVRVIVSRFERDVAQRGRVIEGWQYELFALDADPVAWPAAEGVAAFFGRTAQENRFAQEDKELQLDRIFSYGLAGQELATMIGLLTWNLQIARGFELARPPTELPAQPLATLVIDDRPVPPCTVEAAPIQEEAVRVPGTGEAAPIQEEPVRVPDEPAPVLDPNGARERLNEALDELEWAELLVNRPGWRWRVGRGELQCPDDQVLSLSAVERPPRTRLFFTGRRGMCDGCQFRAACFTSASTRAAKMTNFTVDSDAASRLRERLLQVPRWTRPRPRVLPSTAEPSKVKRRGDLPVQPPSAESRAGPYAIAVSLFLPAQARRVLAHAASHLTTHVDVVLPPSRRPPLLIAASVGARQHRRLTWAQHIARYALPAQARVRVTYAGAGRLTPLLDSPAAQEQGAA